MKTVKIMLFSDKDMLISEGFMSFEKEDDFKQLRLHGASILVQSPCSYERKDVFQHLYKKEK